MLVFVGHLGQAWLYRGGLVLVAVPAAEVMPAGVVEVQMRVTVPEAPAVKVTEAPVLLEVMLPLVMLHCRVLLPWEAVLAELPVLPAVT